VELKGAALEGQQAQQNNTTAVQSSTTAQSPADEQEAAAVRAGLLQNVNASGSTVRVKACKFS
jgi:hypothetical protein